MMPKLRNLFLTSLLFWAFLSLRAEAADDALERALLNMQNQVNTLEEELANYRGRIEELEHEKQQLTLENSELKAKLSENTAAFEKEEQAIKDKTKEQTTTVNMHKEQGGGSATLTSKKQEEKGRSAEFVKIENKDNKSVKDKGESLKESTAASKKAYNDAYALLEKNELDKAALAFSAFAAKYPDDRLTPNSYYWLGQVQYLKKNYEMARVSFLNTAKFKTSPKRADALFKLGQTSEALGDKDKARRFYEVLISSYPDSSSATLGKKALEKLGKDSQ